MYGTTFIHVMCTKQAAELLIIGNGSVFPINMWNNVATSSKIQRCSTVTMLFVIVIANLPLSLYYVTRCNVSVFKLKMKQVKN